jgi:hypothetical protein
VYTSCALRRFDAMVGRAGWHLPTDDVDGAEIGGVREHHGVFDGGAGVEFGRQRGMGVEVGGEGEWLEQLVGT